MAIDERLIGAIHVEAAPASELPAGDRDRHAGHAVFQASTIAALLDGAYDGDVSFGELRLQGDFGLGTLDACDGEMIALEGSFLRADADGLIHPVPDSAKTPFAVLTFFAPRHRVELAGPLSHDRMLAAIDAAVGHPEQVHAVRIDGSFARIRARSVPRQRKPYRPLVEVVADQRVFDLDDVAGTMVGFRFPDRAEGVNVAGYHLHFVSADRERGGHVLDCELRSALAAVDDSVDLHLELPPGVEVGGGPGAADAIERVERSG